MVLTLVEYAEHDDICSVIQISKPNKWLHLQAIRRVATFERPPTPITGISGILTRIFWYVIKKYSLAYMCSVLTVVLAESFLKQIYQNYVESRNVIHVT